MTSHIFNKNFALSSISTKNIILEFLNKNIPEYAYQKEVILDDAALDVIKNGNYVLIPRSKGAKFWMAVFKNENNIYAVMVKKIHSKYRRETKQSKTFVRAVNADFKGSLYKGTIFECVFKEIGDSTYVIIDDIHMHAGQHVQLKSKEDRLMMISNILLKDTVQKNNFNMSVSSYYHINENSITQMYSKDNTHVQDIIFFPQMYQGPIYKYIIVPGDFQEDIIEKMTYRMDKTAKEDVYYIFDASGEKIDMALIPNISKSKECKSWFKKTNSLMVEFIRDQRRNKWVPVKVIK